jgi:hypothetical protein
MLSEKKVLLTLLEFLGLDGSYGALAKLNKSFETMFRDRDFGGSDEVWRLLYSIEFTRYQYSDH